MWPIIDVLDSRIEALRENSASDRDMRMRGVKAHGVRDDRDDGPENLLLDQSARLAFTVFGKFDQTKAHSSGSGVGFTPVDDFALGLGLFQESHLSVKVALGALSGSHRGVQEGFRVGGLGEEFVHAETRGVNKARSASEVAYVSEQTLMNSSTFSRATRM